LDFVLQVTAVHSSTSSSNKTLPKPGNTLSLILGVLLAIIALLFVETRLRATGLKPNVRDSPELWAAQRELAARIGKDALIVIGGSRSQLAIDLQALKETTGLKPIMLSINGSRYFPVLEDLASDPRITGTIIIDSEVHHLFKKNRHDKPVEWTKFYNDNYKGLLAPAFETKLKTFLQNRSALYASMFPFDKLINTIISPKQKYSPRYLTTTKDRQMNGDYSLVQMPQFYVTRVIRNFGQEKLERTQFRNYADFNNYMHYKIKKTIQSPTKTPSNFIKRLSDINKFTKQLSDRGCEIFFVRFPTDKLVWLIDNARRPKKLYWDVFAQTTQQKTIHFKDYEGLQKFFLPDGSHLDQKDKKAFTTELANIIVNSHALN
jgi:hypothetical protein